MTFSTGEDSTIKKFTRTEVSQQNGRDGKPIWIIFKNSIYDVTNYLDKHPGGKKILLEYAGRDCTRDFLDMGHSNDALKDMKEMKVGEIYEVSFKLMRKIIYFVKIL